MHNFSQLHWVNDNKFSGNFFFTSSTNAINKDNDRERWSKWVSEQDNENKKESSMKINFLSKCFQSNFHSILISLLLIFPYLLMWIVKRLCKIFHYSLKLWIKEKKKRERKKEEDEEEI